MSQDVPEKEFSIVRASLIFYPIKGGSITHFLELSERINPLLKNQLFIAPILKGDYVEFDKKYPFPIARINFFDVKSSWLKFLPFKNIINDFLFGRNVAKQIKKLIRDNYPIDVIHVHADLLGIFISLFCGLYGIKIPLVIMRHGELLEDRDHRSFLSNFTFFLFNYIKPAHLILLDDGTKIGPYIDEMKMKNIPYTIVYHGIDTDIFKPSDKEKQNDEFIVLSTYRFVRYKGLHLAIAAFKSFLDEVQAKNAKLYIIGDGPERENLMRQVADLGLSDKVIFKGEMGVDEVRTYLTQADVVIGPSTETNMNRSIQEAMACEKPVLVFNSGGTAKIIKNMDNGIIVENGNVAELASKLSLLYRDPNLRSLLGEHARQTILESRNWDTRIQKELNVYRTVLKKE